MAELKKFEYIIEFEPYYMGNESGEICLKSKKVTQLVRCRDCGHWNKEHQQTSKIGGHKIAMCAWWSRNYGTIETSEGHWCSYGYRREES